MQINLHKAITTKSLYSLASERTGVVETGSSLRCTVKHSVMKGKQRQARRRSATGARQGCATRRAHGESHQHNLFCVDGSGVSFSVTGPQTPFIETVVHPSMFIVSIPMILLS